MHEGTSTSEPMVDSDYQLVRFDDENYIHIRHLCELSTMSGESVLSFMEDGKTIFCSGCGLHAKVELVDGRAILKAV
ncbi:hypothetical protein PBI_UNTOUCHABLE_86 [Gordonia phage Untouchable]|uniref:Uncharacterized protein n=1 Tax=Gordonia phage Untouchable TaxID=2656542 RepID=A0A649V9U7_9CAUD|nr:hypothetical protein HWC79_gp86 [Gordonia phage Untouchable]QGJ89127.1 hypothetical protein PBI_UNTOUCHABLE_86 [Gordonia phage Untouchable]WAB10470.1 hypothetical protein SEA_PHEPPER_85 [Gordonia phage Phepper]